MKIDENINWFARFASFFIKNYQVSILVIVFLLIGGITGYTKLPRQGMPSVEIPYAVITAVYPQATPEQVESDVTEKIENSLDQVDGIKEVESSSQESVGVVVATMDSGIDLAKTIDNIRRQVNSINDFPSDVKSPQVMEIDADGPDLMINIIGSVGQEKLSEYADQYKSEILRVDGVEKAEVWGGADKKINIKLNLDKLNANGLNYDSVKQILSLANLSMPGGSLEQDKTTLPIQINSRIINVSDLKALQIGYSPLTGIITLDDISDISEDSVLEDNLYVTGYVKDDNFNVSETVTVAAYVKSSEDVVKITDKIHEQIGTLTESIPEDIHVITIYEVAKDVRSMLKDLFSNAWQGLVAILVVLFIFISFRSSIVSAFIIPLVLLTTFLVFQITNLNLNFITLYALILSLGIVIDNAIVIVEGVQRNIKSGLSNVNAAIGAVHDLGPALIAATATTVLVFIPMMFLGGITGEFIKYIPFTILITLVASIVIAFSITPFLSRAILAPAEKVMHKKKESKASWVTEKCILGFCKLVKFILSGKYKIATALIVVVALIVGSGLLATKLAVNIWPEVDDAEFFQITMKYPKNSNQEFKEDKIKEMTDVISNSYGTSDIIKQNLVNFAPFSFYMNGQISDQTQFIVNLVAKDKMTVKNKEIITILQTELDKIQDVEIIAENFTQGPPTAEYPVEVQISGDDLETLETAALDLAAHLKIMAGVKKVDDGVSEDKAPQITVSLDREKTVQAGLLPIQVAGVIRSLYNPEKIMDLQDEATKKNIEVNLGFEDDLTLAKLKGLSLGSVKLADIAEVRQTENLKSINHFAKKRYVEVKVSLEDSVVASKVNSEIENYFTNDKLNNLNLESNAISYRGDMESETQAFDDFGMMMVVSLIAIYALLTFQFKSFVQPFIIMLAIPLAIIGVFPALFILGLPVSFMALLGMVVLMGIVVNNSIILIDKFNKLRADKQYTLTQAILEGVSQRTRPILATTLTTIAGILPLTITQYYWRGMGTTIISGLVASVIFVLIIIPVIYYLYIAVLVKIKIKLRKVS
ncbi:MAG: efflux RND transporter permease subunit [Patescibacteria group bacterium]